MKIGVNGIGEVVMTLKTNGMIALGELVTMNANGTAQKAAVDTEPIGVCASVNSGYIGVQIKGGMVVPYEGSTLTVGLHALKATASGGIAKATSGVARLVVAVDTVNKTAEVVF